MVCHGDFAVAISEMLPSVSMTWGFVVPQSSMVCHGDFAVACGEMLPRVSMTWISLWLRRANGRRTNHEHPSKKPCHGE
jgi:hypothetical protein